MDTGVPKLKEALLVDPKDETSCLIYVTVKNFATRKNIVINFATSEIFKLFCPNIFISITRRNKELYGACDKLEI